MPVERTFWCHGTRDKPHESVSWNSQWDVSSGSWLTLDGNPEPCWVCGRPPAGSPGILEEGFGNH